MATSGDAGDGTSVDPENSGGRQGWDVATGIGRELQLASGCCCTQAERSHSHELGAARLTLPSTVTILVLCVYPQHTCADSTTPGASSQEPDPEPVQVERLTDSGILPHHSPLLQ